MGVVVGARRARRLKILLSILITSIVMVGVHSVYFALAGIGTYDSILRAIVVLFVRVATSFDVLAFTYLSWMAILCAIVFDALSAVFYRWSWDPIDREFKAYAGEGGGPALSKRAKWTRAHPFTAAVCILVLAICGSAILKPG
jgi:hypothetical protein